MPKNINNISESIRKSLLSKNLKFSSEVKENNLINFVGDRKYIPKLANKVESTNVYFLNSDIYLHNNISSNKYIGSEEITINELTGNKSKSNNTFIKVKKQSDLDFSEDPNLPLNKYAKIASSQFYKNIYFDSDEKRKIQLSGELLNSDKKGVYSVKPPKGTEELVKIFSVLGIDNVSPFFGNPFSTGSELEDVSRKELLNQLKYTVSNKAVSGGVGGILKGIKNALKEGSSIVFSDFRITRPKGSVGSVIDKVSVFESPTSIIPDSALPLSSFSDNDIKANKELLLYTGKGQIIALIENLNNNRFKLKLEDNRGKKLIGTINPRIYYLDNGDGDILLKGGEKTDFEKRFGYITSENDLKGSSLLTFDENSADEIGGMEIFSWSDEKLNKQLLESYSNANELMKEADSLLYKTQQLFNTNKINMLLTAKGKIHHNDKMMSTVKLNGTRYISKGSQVLTKSAIDGNETDPNNIFCRVWNIIDRYDEVSDLQKHSGLNYYSEVGENNISKLSVLDDNGFVRIAPDFESKDIKKFMFSIENLAYDVNISNLLPEEIGDGDPITGTRGRIMWFPPYDLTFTDNSDVNYDSINFIGRGEPIYTYNNTERSGTLSFKLLVDYPSYLENIKSLSGEKEYLNNLAHSMIAGCADVQMPNINFMTQKEKDEVEAKTVVAEDEVIIEKKDVPPPDFKIYFPNDSYSFSLLADYENGDGVGLGVTYSDGVVFEGCGGGAVRSKLGCPCAQSDNTDFGLNAQQITLPDGNSYNGISDPLFFPSLAEYIVKNCKSCRIKISGFASNDGVSNKNQELSQKRAEAIKDFLLQQLQLANDPIGEKRFAGQPSGEGEISSQGCPKLSHDCSSIDVIPDVDKECKKKSRSVLVSFEIDETLTEDFEKSKKTPQNIDPEKESVQFTNDVKRRVFNEYLFFKKLGEFDKFALDNITDKIKFFHPAFHSITPEGFNARLNFLKQCTRQGHTENNGDPNNLAFGKPPVCILRIGDFYYTKIIITNVDFDFSEGLWDLNPEGIGVQPMICNVSINFKFIGGSSLTGPIHKLQNAITSNFFANTMVYDTTSNYNKDGKIEGGLKLKKGKEEEKKADISTDNITTPEINQEEFALNNSEATNDEVLNENKKLFKFLSKETILTFIDTDGDDLLLTVKSKFKIAKVDNLVDDVYRIKTYIVDKETNEAVSGEKTILFNKNETEKEYEIDWNIRLTNKIDINLKINDNLNEILDIFISVKGVNII
jgi:hypothetical protein